MAQHVSKLADQMIKIIGGRIRMLADGFLLIPNEMAKRIDQGSLQRARPLFIDRLNFHRVVVDRAKISLPSTCSGKPKMPTVRPRLYQNSP